MFSHCVNDSTATQPSASEMDRQDPVPLPHHCVVTFPLRWFLSIFDLPVHGESPRVKSDRFPSLYRPRITIFNWSARDIILRENCIRYWIFMTAISNNRLLISLDTVCPPHGVSIAGSDKRKLFAVRAIIKSKRRREQWPANWRGPFRSALDNCVHAGAFTCISGSIGKY